MNEYTRIQNTKDRANILAQLVAADALAMTVPPPLFWDPKEAFDNYRQSRAALWALLEPKTEETA
jgi:hypothetical protein